MTAGTDFHQRNALKFTSSKNFSAWLHDQQASLAFTTYEVGKLFLVGLQSNGRLSLFERTFNRPMGLFAPPGEAVGSLWMSSLYQLWRFENALTRGQDHQGFDCLLVPQVGFTTGDLDIHDINVDSTGRTVFVSTLFSCIATTSSTHNFAPIWKPPFITELAADDRCHLNGLAMDQGRPRFVTLVAAANVAAGWRNHRQAGGVVMDCQTNETVAAGLSMPHSPRLYRDSLWLLDAGSGYFGRVELPSGRFQSLTFCPGFLRGLCFIGDYAVVTTSKPRLNKTFGGLSIQDQLSASKSEAKCQLTIIDLRSFQIAHWLRFEGLINEIYDVAVLPGVRRPMALGFNSEEIHRTLSMGEPQAL